MIVIRVGLVCLIMQFIMLASTQLSSSSSSPNVVKNFTLLLRNSSTLCAVWSWQGAPSVSTIKSIRIVYNLDEYEEPKYLQLLEDLSVTEVCVYSLTFSRRYRVCLIVVPVPLSGQLESVSCEDLTTANNHWVASIGSAVGASLALVFVLLLMCITRYIRRQRKLKYGINVSRGGMILSSAGGVNAHPKNSGRKDSAFESQLDTSCCDDAVTPNEWSHSSGGGQSEFMYYPASSNVMMNTTHSTMSTNSTAVAKLATFSNTRPSITNSIKEEAFHSDNSNNGGDGRGGGATTAATASGNSSGSGGGMPVGSGSGVIRPRLGSVDCLLEKGDHASLLSGGNLQRESSTLSDEMASHLCIPSSVESSGDHLLCPRIDTHSSLLIKPESDSTEKVYTQLIATL